MAWFSQLYLWGQNKMHLVGVLWFLIIFLYTLKQIKNDIPLTNLKNVVRVICYSFALCYFTHLFFDLWAYVLVFFFDNHGTISSIQFANRISQNFVFMGVFYMIMSSPQLSKDLPSLHRIKILGNINLYLCTFIILGMHLYYLFTGMLTLSYVNQQPYHFFIGYLPMKVMLALTYVSAWHPPKRGKVECPQSPSPTASAHYSDS